MKSGRFLVIGKFHEIHMPNEPRTHGPIFLAFCPYVIMFHTVAMKLIYHFYSYDYICTQF